jgi:hypothetical protein
MASSKPRRYGAFLRLYGPREAKTHAVLVMGHEPREDTPEGFQAELVEERRVERLARGPGERLPVGLRLKFLDVP